jgi:hypothetical protein
MKVILFLAAVYALIINQCYQKKPNYPVLEKNTRTMIARDTSSSTSQPTTRFALYTPTAKPQYSDVTVAPPPLVGKY